MEADELTNKLKANGSVQDLHDLDYVYKEYNSILKKLSPKDQGIFTLNILCMFCRNLEKVPTWKDRINSETLIAMTIEWSHRLWGLRKPDRVKALSCLYYLHKHATQSTIPPEIILNLSSLPFRNEEELFEEYSKTYWAILTDRLIYIEKLKRKNVNIGKLLPNVVIDVSKIIQVYKVGNFCNEVLLALIQKLYHLFGDRSAKELNDAIGNIFESLAKKSDLISLKTAKDTLIYDTYKKFVTIFCIVAENSTKCQFHSSILEDVAKFFMAALGHRSDISYCLQTFYLNLFCNLLTERPNVVFLEKTLNELSVMCDAAEKLGYNKVMVVTYPFISQILRVYMGYAVIQYDKVEWAEYFSLDLQESYLRLIMYLNKRMRNTDPFTKCDNCKLRTSLHDALRLCFTTKNVVSKSINSGMDITSILPLLHELVEHQNGVLQELTSMRCANVSKYMNKSQTDIHNMAILLNKYCYYGMSIKMFDMYIRNEYTVSADWKNIARSLYNKAICEADCKRYKDALRSAFLSVVFSGEDNLLIKKYLMLVVDIKSKASNSEDGSDGDSIQTMTILNVGSGYSQNEICGDYTGIFTKLRFSKLLKLEYAAYVENWPSVLPIAGVWTSFMHMLNRKHVWLSGQPKEVLVKDEEEFLLRELCRIMLDTPRAARTIHCDVFKDIVCQVLKRLLPYQNQLQFRIVYATLMFLKTEYDIADAGLKYGWKKSEKVQEPDLVSVSQTLSQEGEVLQPALRAVCIWAEILADVMKDAAVMEWVSRALHVTDVFVPLLLYFGQVSHSLQLAHVCCQLSYLVNDLTIYARNVGLILYHSTKASPEVSMMFDPISNNMLSIMRTECQDTVLACICEAAIYYARTNKATLAAHIVGFVQKHVLKIYESTNCLYDRTMVRLLEAQEMLCHNRSHLTSLSAVSAIQRYCYTIKNNGVSWVSLRRRSLQTKCDVATSSERTVRLCRELQLWRRGRSMAAGAVAVVAASTQARLYAYTTNANKPDDAQTKIEHYLKFILGQQPLQTKKTKIFDDTAVSDCRPAKEIITRTESKETMLEAKSFGRNDRSPTLCITSVPAFVLPEFLLHEKTCECYACFNPNCSALAAEIGKLEAAMYFRSGELAIAHNYFEGVLKTIDFAESKLECFVEMLRRRRYQGFVVDTVEEHFRIELKRLKAEVLIEKSFFEFANDHEQDADDAMVTTQELLEEIGANDRYIRCTYMNLLSAAKKLKDKTGITNRDKLGIEDEFDKLKLSPNANTFKYIIKTPETKPEKPPSVGLSKIVVDEEEVPKVKRKVITLNLEESSPEKDAEKQVGTEKLRVLRNKKTLKRATSPGKLLAEETNKAALAKPKSKLVKPRKVQRSKINFSPEEDGVLNKKK